MASESAKRRKKRRARDAARKTGPGRTGGAGEEPAPAASGGEGPGARRPVPAAASAARARPARRHPRGGEDGPPPPWGSFPLIELTVLIAIVMLVLGFFFVDGPRRTVLIICGLALGSIGGLELSIREHFAGYRSHTLVLAGVPSLAVLALLFYAGPSGLPQLARLAIALAVLAGASVLLSGAFARRSGGLRFRFASWRDWIGRR